MKEIAQIQQNRAAIEQNMQIAEMGQERKASSMVKAGVESRKDVLIIPLSNPIESETDWRGRLSPHPIKKVMSKELVYKRRDASRSLFSSEQGRIFFFYHLADLASANHSSFDPSPSHMPFFLFKAGERFGSIFRIYSRTANLQMRR